LPKCGESAGGFGADSAALAAETRLRPIAAGLADNESAAQFGDACLGHGDAAMKADLVAG
jgi:hypothetical protein